MSHIPIIEKNNQTFFPNSKNLVKKRWHFNIYNSKISEYNQKIKNN